MSAPEVTPTAAPAATPHLVTLTMGAIAMLVQLVAGTQWTKITKEKIAAGRLKARLEDHLLSEPDPCLLAPTHPEYRAESRKAALAAREWRKRSSTLELSSLERQAFVACMKHAGSQEGGADEFLAELLTAAGITE